MENYRKMKTAIFELVRQIENQDAESGRIFRESLVFNDQEETVTYIGPTKLPGNLKEIRPSL